MNKPLAISELRKGESADTLDQKQANIFSIRTGKSAIDEVVARNPVSVGILNNFKGNFENRDVKALDYLLIIGFAIIVHGLVIDRLKHMPLPDQSLPEPVKLESKVQINFVQPKPKPIEPPPKPIVQEPPKPKVVPLKKPPKPKVQPKPQPQVVSQAPVTESRVEAPVAAPVYTAPPPPPPPPKPKVVEKVTQPSAGAGYLHNPPPEFPEIAQERGWGGKVLLKVHVLASGKPDTINIAKSSGHDVLDDEAIRTVKKWSFVPGKRGDTPIDGWVTVPISFNLQN